MNALLDERFHASGPETVQELSGRSRQIEGVFQPASRKELLQILERAKAQGLRLHPVSGGKNWGFGSRLPVTQRAYILDLSRLRSLRLHLDQDYAEIEPGVTQGQLQEALQNAGDSHFFNVTGAGRQTSVLGNALERGIGYFGSKKDDILDLEVAATTTAGSVKMSYWTKDQATNPHHPGLGPDLTGMLLQSGLGIVTSARLRLKKRPPYMAALLIQMQAGVSSEQYFDQIGLLCREGFISSVPQLANRQRMLTTFGPYLSRAQREQMAKSSAEWSCLAPVGGSKSLVGALHNFVGERMEGLAHCRLLDADLVLAEPFLAPALDLALGRPNDFALPGVSFAVFPERERESGERWRIWTPVMQD